MTLKRKLSKNKSTSDEKRYVLENTGKMTKAQIAEKLGRSESFVKSVQRNARTIQPCTWIDMPKYSDELKNQVDKRIEYIGECWIVKKNEIMIDGHFYTLSRLLYYWHNEIDLKHVQIIRDCHNDKCVNPKHYHAIRTNA